MRENQPNCPKAFLSVGSFKEKKGNRSFRLVSVSVCFHESGFGFSNLAVRFSLLFWFPENMGVRFVQISFETNSPTNETSLRWILWIQISETALTNTFLFSFRFETETKEN